METNKKILVKINTQRCSVTLMHGITRILCFTSMLSLLEYLLVSTHLRQVLDAARQAVSQVFHQRPTRRHRLMHFVSHHAVPIKSRRLFHTSYRA